VLDLGRLHNGLIVVWPCPRSPAESESRNAATGIRASAHSRFSLTQPDMPVASAVRNAEGVSGVWELRVGELAHGETFVEFATARTVSQPPAQKCTSYPFDLLALRLIYHCIAQYS
jgi:hypothetical protein